MLPDFDRADAADHRGALEHPRCQVPRVLPSGRSTQSLRFIGSTADTEAVMANATAGKASVRGRVADAAAAMSTWLVAVGLVSVVASVLLSNWWTDGITCKYDAFTSSTNCEGRALTVFRYLAGVGWFLFPAAFLTGIVSLVHGTRRKGRALAMILTSLVLGFLTLLLLIWDTRLTSGGIPDQCDVVHCTFPSASTAWSSDGADLSYEVRARTELKREDRTLRDRTGRLDLGVPL
jgi:hypothetical protein